MYLTDYPTHEKKPEEVLVGIATEGPGQPGMREQALTFRGEKPFDGPRERRVAGRLGIPKVARWALNLDVSLSFDACVCGPSQLAGGPRYRNEWSLRGPESAPRA